MAGGLGWFPITASAICDFFVWSSRKTTSCLDAIKALLKMLALFSFKKMEFSDFPKRKKWRNSPTSQHPNIPTRHPNIPTRHPNIPTNLCQIASWSPGGSIDAGMGGICQVLSGDSRNPTVSMPSKR